MSQRTRIRLSIIYTLIVLLIFFVNYLAFCLFINANRSSRTTRAIMTNEHLHSIPEKIVSEFIVRFGMIQNSIASDFNGKIP